MKILSKKTKIRLFAIGICAVITLGCMFSGSFIGINGAGGFTAVRRVFAKTAYTGTVPAAEEITQIANGIIQWKKQDVGSGADGYLINDEFLSLAGTTPGDWYPVGLSRLGVADNFDGYLAVINDVIDKRYKTAEKLDKAKATEWHRITLAMLSCGGNPKKAGLDGDIDLIADGVYNRADENGGLLGKQGINGYIWGLIALDSMAYAVHEKAFYTRDDIILNILSREIDGGGWALSGDVPDPDITAMAIQSLAPYFNSEKHYSYKKGDGVFVTKVRDSVNRALKKLSSVQQADGGFISWGTPNGESAAQVLVALCSLGKNPFETDDFVRDGKTVYDGLIKYRNSDGGFLHSFVYDEENPSSKPDESNTMAGEQALYGMASLVRFLSGKRRLYDFRPEQSESVKNAVKNVAEEIEKLTYSTENAQLERVYKQYLEIDYTERSYVYNYEKLSDILAFKGIAYAEEKPDYNNGGDDVSDPLYEFTAADKAKTDALPEELTTAYRAEVLKLYAKIKNSFDFDGKTKYIAKLEKAKNQIDLIENEIAGIKRLIKEKLYPFDHISLKDKKTVYELYNRYIALSEYDRSAFEKTDVEGLLKSKTQVDNLQTALIISVISAAVVVVIVVTTVLNIKKRKKQKLADLMPESDE